MTKLPTGHRALTLNDLMYLSETIKKPYVLAMDLLQQDPHQWSDQPCKTCQTISTLIEMPFGCCTKGD